MAAVEHERTGIIDQITWRFSKIVMYFVFAILCVMIYEIVVRYVFFAPTLWANELCSWIAGAFYPLAGIYTMQQRGHIRITILYDRVSRNVQRGLDVVSNIFITIFCFGIFWGGFNDAYVKLMRWEGYGTHWDPPIPATLKPLILFAVLVLTIQAWSNLYYDWHKKKITHGEQEFDDIIARERAAAQAVGV